MMPHKSWELKGYDTNRNEGIANYCKTDEELVNFLKQKTTEPILWRIQLVTLP